ncbi:MAG: hypothetical protein WD530_05675 [Vicingaceae bacterium]
MKTKRLVLMLSAAICFSFSTKAGNSGKIVKPIASKSISLNFQHFDNYLRNGRPLEVEGFYATSDKRYVMAIVKNEAKEHDFIGVMVKAANSKYTTGELRFNFVQENDSILSGFFYDQNGNAQAMQLKIKTSKPNETCLFSKIAYSEIPNENFVEVLTLDQLLRNPDY